MNLKLKMSQNHTQRLQILVGFRQSRVNREACRQKTQKLWLGKMKWVVTDPKMTMVRFLKKMDETKTKVSMSNKNGTLWNWRKPAPSAWALTLGMTKPWSRKQNWDEHRKSFLTCSGKLRVIVLWDEFRWTMNRCWEFLEIQKWKSKMSVLQTLCRSRASFCAA